MTISAKVHLSIFMVVLTVSACATHSPPIIVRIPEYHAVSGNSKLSSIPPATLKVLSFNDARKSLEGSLTAAFGVPMGNIRFDRSPATIVREVVVSELKAAGHKISDSVNAPQLSGTVREFEAHSDTTPLYWDIIGNIAVSLQVLYAKATIVEAPLDYQVRCTDRTYLWPTEAVIAGVMGTCINDFVDKLRNDGRASEALRKSLASR